MPLSATELLLRLGVAMILGASIGWERENHQIPAGLRTHLLVALASATFGLVSFYVAAYQPLTNEGGITRFDAGRIASNIVVGIGFLGGGAILQSGMRVKGLTTAASLWLTAAIGLAAGGGMYLLATASTAFCLFALVVLRYAIELPRRRIVRIRVAIELEGDVPGRPALVELLSPVGMTPSDLRYERDFARNHSKVEMNVLLPGEAFEEPLIRRLETLNGLRRIRVEPVE
ncbi:MAG: MgtC/SapB family protein [Isosphaeraceae bacterium]